MGFRVWTRIIVLYIPDSRLSKESWNIFVCKTIFIYSKWSITLFPARRIIGQPTMYENFIWAINLRVILQDLRGRMATGDWFGIGRPRRWNYRNNQLICLLTRILQIIHTKHFKTTLCQIVLFVMKFTIYLGRCRRLHTIMLIQSHV